MNRLLRESAGEAMADDGDVPYVGMAGYQVVEADAVSSTPTWTRWSPTCRTRAMSERTR